MTLYAIRPHGPDADPDSEEEVVNKLKRGWDYLDQAIALWRLVNECRADEIEAIKDRAALADPDGHPRFELANIAELVRLLTGFEEALVDAGIVDARWSSPLGQVKELAPRIPGIDVRPERTQRELEQVLAEVMANVSWVRDFLAEAKEKGCFVELS
ncbi:MAG: hypothetical protein M3R63_18245 [Actinomycetota bacterium]|nr:hypothetical protein [Actinomycetota bacterium]